MVIFVPKEKELNNMKFEKITLWDTHYIGVTTWKEAEHDITSITSIHVSKNKTVQSVQKVVYQFISLHYT
jgi:hypothetical protein